MHMRTVFGGLLLLYGLYTVGCRGLLDFLQLWNL